MIYGRYVHEKMNEIVGYPKDTSAQAFLKERIFAIAKAGLTFYHLHNLKTYINIEYGEENQKYKKDLLSLVDKYIPLYKELWLSLDSATTLPFYVFKRTEQQRKINIDRSLITREIMYTMSYCNKLSFKSFKNPIEYFIRGYLNAKDDIEGDYNRTIKRKESELQE